MKSKLNKRGISLIVLVITIIIMIILAAAVILSLNSSGIIGRAHKAKDMSDLESLKEAYSVVESENILEQEEKTDIEMLLIAAEKCGLSSYFESDGTYTGQNDEIKEWVQEKFILSDIVAKGYIVSVVDGTTYITGVTAETAADILSITENEVQKYTIETATGVSVELGNAVGSDYVIKKSGEEVAKIIVFGDYDRNGKINGRDLQWRTREGNIYAVDVNHDGFASNDDTDHIAAFMTDLREIVQNAKVRKVTVVSN